MSGVLEPVPPWLASDWQRLLARFAQGRLPHALLLEGREGIGKGRLTARLAQRLLCTGAAVEQEPCGECRGCRLFASGAHPDARRLQPDPEKRRPVIPVDAVRDLTAFLALSSQYSGHRVAVIEPADAMNVNAANSLLKTLEEPSDGCFLLLVTARPAHLPATVRSRCQRVTLPAPDHVEAVSWLRERVDAPEALLELADGAPFAALALAESGAADRMARMASTLVAVRDGRIGVDEAGADWAEEGAAVAARTLQRVLVALLRASAGAKPPSGIGDGAAFRSLAQRLDSRLAFEYCDEVVATLRALQQPLNEPLTLEALFARWQQASAPVNR